MIWVHPRSKLVDGKLVCSRAIVATLLISLKLSRDPETETGSLENEKTVHRIHDTLEKGLQMVLRSLVAPHMEGRWILQSAGLRFDSEVFFKIHFWSTVVV